MECFGDFDDLAQAEVMQNLISPRIVAQRHPIIEHRFIVAKRLHRRNLAQIRERQNDERSISRRRNASDCARPDQKLARDFRRTPGIGRMRRADLSCWRRILNAKQLAPPRSQRSRGICRICRLRIVSLSLFHIFVIAQCLARAFEAAFLLPIGAIFLICALPRSRRILR